MDRRTGAAEETPVMTTPGGIGIGKCIRRLSLKLRDV
jgi:hypothetical protein